MKKIVLSHSGPLGMCGIYENATALQSCQAHIHRLSFNFYEPTYTELVAFFGDEHQININKLMKQKTW